MHYMGVGSNILELVIVSVLIRVIVNFVDPIAKISACHHLFHSAVTLTQLSLIE